MQQRNWGTLLGSKIHRSNSVRWVQPPRQVVFRDPHQSNKTLMLNKIPCRWIHQQEALLRRSIIIINIEWSRAIKVKNRQRWWPTTATMTLKTCWCTMMKMITTTTSNKWRLQNRTYWLCRKLNTNMRVFQEVNKKEVCWCHLRLAFKCNMPQIKKSYFFTTKQTLCSHRTNATIKTTWSSIKVLNFIRIRGRENALFNQSLARDTLNSRTNFKLKTWFKS